MPFEKVYESLLHRIMANVEEVDLGHKVDDEASPCWLWLGRCDKRSHRPKINLYDKGKYTTKRVYRLLYELVYDCTLEPAQTLDHECEQVTCVRPEHLKVMDAKRNASLAVSRWRSKYEKGYKDVDA
jgi:hypothetical protein